ncbi:MAG: Holliday junction branch migration protein RuvA [Coriobacteriia bacterium]|nr:Holliday junction branch migration protein RuvA [Coriobacteriia bacterium]
MISFVTGRVHARAAGYAVIEVGGVGLRLNMSTNSLAALPTEGDTATVHTHLHVREDELTLYGFGSEDEREAFGALLTVSGVGPKVALAVLSALTPDALAEAVATQDVALISGVPGIGSKTAQRIILDLADKLGALSGPTSPGGAPRAGSAPAADAREALLAMGFSAAEVAVALKGARGDDSAALVRTALTRLGSA